MAIARTGRASLPLEFVDRASLRASLDSAATDDADRP